jgi:hypothetical protein
MLFETRTRLIAGVNDVVLRNALIESFCIHARSLIDFFNDRKGAKASDFTEPTYVPFPNGPIADTLVTKLSTQIAHLTLNRTADPQKKIDHTAREELTTKLAAELVNFFGNLKPEYQALWPSSLKIPNSSPPAAGVACVTSAPTATNAITITST